jgi:hypothetical protein
MVSAKVIADLSVRITADLSAHISADLSADLSAEAVRLDFCGVDDGKGFCIHMFRRARAATA